MGIEILNGKFDVWMAPTGEAYPDINIAPSGNWALIGNTGSDLYKEDGITFDYEQDTFDHYGSGDTVLLKVSRLQERAKYTFTLFDLRSAELVKAFNLATGTTDTAAASGSGGHQSFGIHRGTDVTEKAFLIRGENKSTDLVTENIQIEIPRAIQMANLSLQLQKGEEAGALFELMTIKDTAYQSGNALYGRWLIGDEVAL